jgi:hypothetical protein
MNKHFDAEKVKPLELKGSLNTSDEVIMEQVKQNIRRQLPQVQPYHVNSDTALIVCGGPSLEETKRELRDAYWAGGKIVALNGAYKWCIENNFKPSACIVLDARESNARFVEEPVERCRYLLASQCHPKTFEHCADRDTFIWHACSGGDTEYEVLKEYYFNQVHPIQIGTTVGIRAISVLRMLGFLRMEVFGLDSCWLDGKHHSYEQEQNARERRVKVWLQPEGRPDKAMHFECAPWHARQIQDFQELIKERGNLFQLNVHGRGVIAAMLRTGASIQMEN